MKTLKNDLILLGIILAVSILCWGIPALFQSDKEAVVKVIQDGVVTAQFPLTKNNTISIPCEDGYNCLFINDGKVSVTDADCPDKICVRQHDISKNGESIICLPHKLVIQIESKEESELDAVTY